MAKQHWYEDQEEDGQPLMLDFEEKQVKMLGRCLNSIQDLLDEEARGTLTKMSMQQTHEMEEIIKDARVQGLMS